MGGLCFALKASNSSQSMILYVDAQKDGEISITMTGLHEGQPIQIDFDNLSAEEAIDLADYIKGRAKKQSIGE